MLNITTTTLPNGIVGVPYSQTIEYLGGSVPPVTFSLDSGTLPTSVSLGTSGTLSGTPTVSGTYNFVIEAADSDVDVDTQSYTVIIFSAATVSPQPNPGDSAVFLNAGDQLQFTASGGSGNYSWSVDGGNLINPTTGLLTAVNGGTYTVTMLDQVSGQVILTTVVISSQAQFCVQATSVDEVASGTPCCEYNVECGDRLTLRVPSFHVIEDGMKKAVVFGNLVQAVTGEASALQSRSTNAGAVGNPVSFARNAYFEIVTSFDMAQTANGEFGIGWSPTDVDSTIASIKHAVVWFTDGADRKVEIRNSTIPEVGSDFVIAQGDVVSFGNIGGQLQLWINSVLVFTSDADPSTCGDMLLDIGIADANKTIGGYVGNLSWSISTPGTPAEVGLIDANGVYTAPSNPLIGVIDVVGALNNANFFVKVRNIKPTPRRTHPNAFIAGRRATIWVTNQKATDNDIMRIASDGSPDAIQNPGMIELGVLQGSATFAEDNETQDFDNDEGTYLTVISRERATLTGTFLEVRDLDKLAMLMQHTTLHPTVNGVRELSSGGKTCGGCDLRVAMIMEAGACGEGWDVIYMPRVQNTGNLSLEIGKQSQTGAELSFRVLPDTTRPAGKQLWSMYQMDNCTGDTNDTCGASFPLINTSGTIESSSD